MKYIDDEYTALDEIFDEKQREKKMIPMQVLDDIKAEIQKEENIWYHDCEHDFSKNFDVIRVDTVLDIIDKHIGKRGE